MDIFNKDKNHIKELNKLYEEQQLQLFEISIQIEDYKTEKEHLLGELDNIKEELNKTQKELQETKNNQSQTTNYNTKLLKEKLELQNKIKKLELELEHKNKELLDNNIDKLEEENKKLKKELHVAKVKYMEYIVKWSEIDIKFNDLLEASSMLLNFYNEHKNKKVVKRSEILQSSINELKEKLEKMENNLTNSLQENNKETAPTKEYKSLDEVFDEVPKEIKYKSLADITDINSDDNANEVEDGHNKFKEKLKEIYGGH